MKDLTDYRSIPEDKYLQMEKQIKDLQDENLKLKEGANIHVFPVVKVSLNMENPFSGASTSYKLKMYTPSDYDKDEHCKLMVKYTEEQIEFYNKMYFRTEEENKTLKSEVEVMKNKREPKGWTPFFVGIVLSILFYMVFIK